MAVQFLFGRAGAGKTHACIAAIARALAEPDDGRRLILITPEQASAQMERALALAAPGGGYARAEVLSFTRLALRVLGDLAPLLPVLSPTARRMALRRVLDSLGPRATSAFGPAVDRDGFIAQLDGLLRECQNEGIAPAALRAAAERLPDDDPTRPRCAAVAQVYEAYLAWRGDRLDRGGMVGAARERVAECGWLRGARVWVDGFAGFTGEELATLIELARVAEHVTITLLADPDALALRDPRIIPDELSPFQPTEQTYQRLRSRLTEAGVSLAPPQRLPASDVDPLPRFHAPALARLEARLVALAQRGDPDDAETEIPARLVPADGVRVVRCGTLRDELQHAAREIRRTVATGAGRFRDFAVIARDVSLIAPEAPEVFAAYDVPVFVDQRRPLTGGPLASLVDALFEVIASDYATRSVLRLLRTGLLRLGRHGPRLAELALERGLSQRAKWERDEILAELRAWEGRAFDAARWKRPLELWEHVRSAIDALGSIGHDGAAVSAARWAEQLYATIDALGVEKTVRGWIVAEQVAGAWDRAEWHRLSWEALCGVLDELHSVLGDVTMTRAQVADTLRSGLREVNIGLAPPTLDQVLVSGIERSRHPDVRHVFLVGFNGGVFPAPPRADRLLSTAQRTALAAVGLEGLTPAGDESLAERLLAYIALTRPSKRLTISFAETGADGEERFPSPLLEDVFAALPGLAVERPEVAPPPVTVAELAEQLATLPPGRDAERAHVERLRAALPAASQRAVEWLLRGREYDNSAESVAPPGDPASGTTRLSFTKFRNYLRCPFRYFAETRLRLRERRGPRAAALDLGNLIHAAIEKLWRGLIEERVELGTLDEGARRQRVDAAVDAMLRDCDAPLLTHLPEAGTFRAGIRARVHEMVAAHAERYAQGAFRPLRVEWPFDDDPRFDAATLLAPVEVALEGGRRLQVVGRIDRVDVATADQTRWLVAYDYKGGAKAPGKRGFLADEPLQLFVYLLALRRATASDPALCDARLGGVLVAPYGPDSIDASKQDPPSLMKLYQPRGWVARELLDLLDRDIFARRETEVISVRLTKDGVPQKKTDCCSAAELDARIDLAERTLRVVGQPLTAGEIPVAPVVVQKQLPCKFCSFKPVCRFERGVNIPRLAEEVLPSLGSAEDDATDASEGEGDE